MAETGKTTVFVIDDHPLVRDSLAMLINQQDDMHVCGEAEDTASALKGVAQAAPDVAIVDLSLKEGSGLDLIKHIKAKAPAVQVVVLSMHDEKLYAERCIRAGARGYVMKRESSKRIVAAIREVRAGRLFLSSQAASLFAERFVGNRHALAEAPMETLSDRELQVFGLIGQGLPTRDIAGSLNVSVKTVQAYCARIKQKLNISSATELLREAVRWHDQQSAG
jgi:DNA-binding NarL/FixJ family response regulator